MANLEQHAAELIGDIRYLEDALARALNTDAAGIYRFLYERNHGLVRQDQRLVPYVVLGSPLDDQLMQGPDETRALLEGA